MFELSGGTYNKSLKNWFEIRGVRDKRGSSYPVFDLPEVNCIWYFFWHLVFQNHFFILEYLSGKYRPVPTGGCRGV